ncbi:MULTISPECIES: LysR family transcriptional regulator [Vibrio]|uniref:LysR family transcriptional regulator n=1 Tax=Vibrio TaxID=662 RepID=UPI0001B957FD|nr:MULTISPECIES: LysR family transcriptional regulator [Vibrio]EEX34309.1 probable transcriptional regulator [Vibrio coralliilyticus ATCC BAA-450]MDE3898352.1 LysR family transcriptional regulator [Vibrio sp. CC007]NOI30435.1 LysR family transcriptional regulator [Vibrio coralliilyticus]NOI50023.1 LysR family transcriptional regulator [Vibrio coralliilyticus]
MDKLVAANVFKRVVELDSFHLAADDLGLSRSAVSKNIAELEGFLGVALITRTTRTMRVTPTGEEYYRQVCQLLDMWAMADQQAMAASSRMQGTLTVSIPMSLGLVSIQPKLCQFAKQYPDLLLNVLLSDEQIDLVTGGIDVAIRGSGHLKDSTLHARKLDTLPRVLCAAPCYLADIDLPLNHPSDLSHHDCLIYSLSTSPTNWLFYSEAEECQIAIHQIRMQTNNTLALKQACVEGLGVMLAPKIMVEEELTRGVLQPILTDWRIPNHDVYAVYPQHKEHSLMVAELIRFLSQEMALEASF